MAGRAQLALVIAAGYGLPAPASREAQRLAARTQALFLDPTYTAKAMAGLIAQVRQARLRDGQTVLFWPEALAVSGYSSAS